MNSILVIHPYKMNGSWVFDDPAVELVREPFVAGADVMIDKMVEDIPDAQKGVTIYFSSKPFPGFQHELIWQREELGGNWYASAQLGLEGWLCPALLLYFANAPERIYVQVKQKTA